ncbi:hypothetical protein BDB00DRAFT_178684 [Zychaea mexicana]|uniref:uncharacterized protein n=1 Tax=Zychaea mexicana TaxID=64656 RepID=UPI0022FE61D3|nr:uncharacterized protein BDB00DRAFT_178684 [Zychaea mexicana]KAI9495960.1 hypothetical protein BDB00DRAFT_178684 [Zychaea mexicana]
MTATNGSVSIELQWPTIPPPLHDVTNNTGLQEIEDSKNGSPTVEKHDPMLRATAVGEAVTVDESLLFEQQQQQQKGTQNEESPQNSMSPETNTHNDCQQSNVMDMTTTHPLSLNNNVEKTPDPSMPSVSEKASTTTPIVVVGSIPCKRTCEDPSFDYPGDTDVKRARAGEPTSSLLSSSSTAIAVPQPKVWCRRCGTTKTPRWRGGPLGSHTLCNACGLRWKNVGKPVEGFNNPTYPPPELPEALKPKVLVPKARAPKPKELQTRESKARGASQTAVEKKGGSSNRKGKVNVTIRLRTSFI